jgi:hypothetical protein
MRTGKAAGVLLRVLGALFVLAAFAALDWYPTVKDLGRRGRERRDLESKINDYSRLAGNFEFTDAAEDSLLSGVDADLRRAVPRADSDDAWAAISTFDLQSRVRDGGIPYARFLFHWQTRGLDLGAADKAGAGPLDGWIGQETANIRDGFALAGVPGSFPWRGIFSEKDPRHGRLASRPVCLAAMAPLPALLNFINRLSWGEARLEIVRLRLKPGTPMTEAWLVCRGVYRVAAPSPWLVEMRPGKGGANLLVDPDSPLLLRKADLHLAPGMEKRDLPPGSSPW